MRIKTSLTCPWVAKYRRGGSCIIAACLKSSKLLGAVEVGMHGRLFQETWAMNSEPAGPITTKESPSIGIKSYGYGEPSQESLVSGLRALHFASAHPKCKRHLHKTAWIDGCVRKTCKLAGRWDLNLGMNNAIPVAKTFGKQSAQSTVLHFLDTESWQKSMGTQQPG